MSPIALVMQELRYGTRYTYGPCYEGYNIYFNFTINLCLLPSNSSLGQLQKNWWLGNRKMTHPEQRHHSMHSTARFSMFRFSKNSGSRMVCNCNESTGSELKGTQVQLYINRVKIQIQTNEERPALNKLYLSRLYLNRLGINKNSPTEVLE